MRYVAMQVLTWGTVAGAMGSAVLLAALNGDAAAEGKVMSLADARTWHAEAAGVAPSHSVEQRLPLETAAHAASQPAGR